MKKKDNNIWNKDILGVYPKEAKEYDKYESLVWDEILILIPILALIDLWIIIFKIGSAESQARSKARLRVNRVALFFVLLIIGMTILGLISL